MLEKLFQHVPDYCTSLEISLRWQDHEFLQNASPTLTWVSWSPSTFCSSDLWCCQYSSPAWYSGIADWWRPHGQVVTETHKITLPDENKLAMDDLCLLEWTDKSYFGRIPSGGMNLKGFDRWEHSEQSHKDKQMQDIESDWLTDTLKNIYWAPTKLTLLSL